jgi:Na+/H+ antiporter NhaC
VARRIVSIGLFVAAASVVATLTASAAAASSGAVEETAAASYVSYGAWSLLPAFITIALAFATHHVLPSLFVGIVSGSVIVFAHSGSWSDLNFLNLFFLPALGSRRYAVILLVYLWFLGGILGVWGKTGGARYFAERVGLRLARGRRSSKVFAWVIGCVFHQGGTVSTVLAGTTIKPLSDRNGVAHEELSYIVDSTASPIATIIPFNAWPVYVGGLVAGLTLGDTVLIKDIGAGQAWFLSAIPFNFYAIFAVAMTLLFAFDRLPWNGRRMQAAMDRVMSTGELDRPGAVPLVDTEALQSAKHGDYDTGLVDFFLPIGMLMGVAIVPFIVTGQLLTGEAFMACTLSAMLLAVVKGMPVRDAIDGFLDGCRSMTLGAIILGMAVTLGNVSGELHTADFLIGAVEQWFPVWALPAALTVVCMVVSFSIGSSFGTYAVIFPIAVPLAFQLAVNAQGLSDAPLAALSADHPEQWADVLFYVKICFGAVLGGAVFGDQCSPISDTTILASMFTGCDLMDHVQTQMPLALIAAGLGILCSTAVALLF